MKTENVVTLIIDGKNKAVTAIQSAVGELTKLDSTASKTGTGIMGMDSLLKKAFTGFTVGLAAKELFDFMQQTLDTADGLNKMSQRVGMSVESLSKLRYAADLNDVSLEDLDTSLDKLNKNIYAAVKGNGEAADSFKLLNISLLDSKGNIRDTESIFMELTDKMGSLPDGVKKSALSMDILGKSGANLIPLMNNGAQGVKNLMNEAKLLGLELSTRTAIEAEAFNDQLTTLKYRAEGLALKVMPGMISEFSEFAYLLEHFNFENVFRYMTWQKPEGFDEFKKQLDEAAKKRAEYEKAKNAAEEEDSKQKARKEAERRKYESAEMKFLNYKKTMYGELLGDFDNQTNELKDQITVFVDIQEQLKNYPELQKKSSELFDQWLDKTNSMSTANVPHLLFEMEKLSHEFGIIPGYLELTQKYLKAMKDPIKAATESFHQGGFDVPIGFDTNGVNKDNPFGLPKKLQGFDTTEMEASIQLIKDRIMEVPIDAALNFLIMEGSMGQTFGSMAQAAEVWYQVAGEKQSVYFEMYKAFAIAETAVNTYNSAVAAYKAMVGVPIIGPGLAVAAAASAIAFGYGNIRRIASTSPGGGVSGVSSPSASFGSLGSGSGVQSMLNSNNTTNNNTSNQPNIYINITGLAGIDDKDKFARDLASSIGKLFKDGVITVGGNG